jgi:hypothetical protein
MTSKWHDNSTEVISISHELKGRATRARGIPGKFWYSYKLSTKPSESWRNHFRLKADKYDLTTMLHADILEVCSLAAKKVFTLDKVNTVIAAANAATSPPPLRQELHSSSGNVRSAEQKDSHATPGPSAKTGRESELQLTRAEKLSEAREHGKLEALDSVAALIEQVLPEQKVTELMAVARCPECKAKSLTVREEADGHRLFVFCGGCNLKLRLLEAIARLGRITFEQAVYALLGKLVGAKPRNHSPISDMSNSTSTRTQNSHPSLTARNTSQSRSSTREAQILRVLFEDYYERDQ